MTVSLLAGLLYPREAPQCKAIRKSCTSNMAIYTASGRVPRSVSAQNSSLDFIVFRVLPAFSRRTILTLINRAMSWATHDDMALKRDRSCIGVEGGVCDAVFKR
jgi:hypothetical protein